MTQEVSDETLGKFARQQNDWFRRVREGSLNPEDVAHVVQQIIDCPFKMDKIKADIIHAYHRGSDIIRKGVLDYIEMVIEMDSHKLDGEKKAVKIDLRYIDAIEARIKRPYGHEPYATTIVEASRLAIRNTRRDYPNYDFMDDHVLVRAVMDVFLQHDITNAGFLHTILSSKDRSKENLDIYNRVFEGLIEQGYSKTEAEKAIERFCLEGN